MRDDREYYMRLALREAEACPAHGDVPVGCVIVRPDADGGGRVIAAGRNRREADGRATAHAEILAIEAACRALGSWRLHGCALYVTLEPCPMCAGAIINAQIPFVYYGAPDEKAGACGGVLDLFAERFNHKPAVYGGILQEKCAAVLQDFFQKIREGRRG